MVEYLSAAFAISFLTVFVVVSGCAALLYVMAGKSRSAVAWLVSCLAGVGLLVLTLGGY